MSIVLIGFGTYLAFALLAATYVAWGWGSWREFLPSLRFLLVPTNVVRLVWEAMQVNRDARRRGDARNQ